ncbi:MAG: CHAT domain-containing protein [Flavobacteriales bacterium]|nr:CHAT domain-containing protein [Flavobacteriales bacterium]
MSRTLFNYSIIAIFLFFAPFICNAGNDLQIEELVFQGDFISAEVIISSRLRNTTISQKEKVLLYHIKGDMAKIAGDMEGALNNWNKAAKIIDKLYPNKENYHRLWKYAHLSNYHYEKINPKLAKEYADSCSSLLKKLSIEQQKEIEIFKIWNIQGQAYKQQTHKNEQEYIDKYNQCFSLYNKSIDFQLHHHTPKHYLANTYHLFGNAYLDLSVHYNGLGDKAKTNENKELSRLYHKKATDIWLSEYGNKHYELAKTKFVEGLLFHYLANGNDEYRTIALNYFKESIQAFGLTPNHFSEIHLELIPNKEDLLMCLKYYTTDLLKLDNSNSGKSAFFEEAEKVNVLAIDVWEQIHSEFKGKNTNQNLAIYDLIPQQEQIAILLRKNNDNNLIVNEDFFLINKKLKYYDLFKEDVSSQNMALAEFQKKLSPKQVFLDYHYSHINKKVYVLWITRANTTLLRIDAKVIDEAKVFRKSIIELNYDDFQKSAISIFQLLFPNGISEVEEIIICPDNVFYSIPFEALLCSEKGIAGKDYRKLDYLINHVTISYALTTDSFVHQINKTNWNLSVFTPSFQSDEFIELPFSQKFGEEAISKLQSKTYSGNTATLTSFKQNKSPLCHISTHAIVGEDIASNFIQFSDGAFYQKDIEQLEYLPNLMVLNTCNSGMGKNLVGDGVNGFVRELHKAGVGTTISNLWEVDDKLSNKLLETFYLNLKDGIGSGVALRLAKLNQIKNAPSSELGAPYYWAGHRMVGEQVIINSSYRNHLPISLVLGSFILIVISLLSIIYYFMKRKTTKLI